MKRPQRLRSGAVVQSGIGLQPRKRGLDPEASPYRAIVVATRTIDDPDNLRGVSVECDVVLVSNQVAFQSVPVVQTQHGVNNAHGLWVPRPTTRIVNGNGEVLNLSRQLSRRGTFIGPPTDFSTVDGDMVLIDFIERNQDFPIIVGCLPHQQSNRRVRDGNGWREGDDSSRGEMRPDEYYVHHYGAEMRINEQGDVLIDTVGAYDDPSTEDDSVSTGQVRVRLKDDLKFTIECDGEDVLEVFKDGTGVHVHLGENAIESIVLGDSFMTLFNAHTHSSAVGPTGPPMPLMTAAQLSNQHKVK